MDWGTSFSGCDRRIMSHDLPSYDEALAIVKAHQFSQWAENANPADLARLAEQTLIEEAGDQPDAIKQILADALAGESLLEGRW